MVSYSYSCRQEMLSIISAVEQSDWYPDMDDIRSKITDRTKAIVIINPNNPTGAVYPKEVLEQIVQIAREHELIIFFR